MQQRNKGDMLFYSVQTLNSSSQIQIRQMRAGDIPFGFGLSSQAGWNQTEGDWGRFLGGDPRGCFVAEGVDGQALGTVVTCRFGSVAWIAMLLVDSGHQGKGVGKSLFLHAVGYLQSEGIETIRLDATLEGQRIYEKLGFISEYELIRYEGVTPEVFAPVSTGKAGACSYPAIVSLDHQVTGTYRESMLEALWRDYPDNFYIHGDEEHPDGYILCRPGLRAEQIGPCIASAQAGEELLAGAFSACRGKNVYIDVPVLNRVAIEYVESYGLVRQRSFMRMYLGEKVNDQLDLIWASSGPEKG